MQRILNKKLAVLLALFALWQSSLAAETIHVPVHDDNEIVTERFAADGDYLLLWFMPEYGFRHNHRNLAARLATLGIEVWQPNILDSLFMLQGSASIKQLNPDYIADIIDHAHTTTGKKIVVAGDSYAALTALRGAHAWQKRPHKQKNSRPLVGGILFSPYTYAAIPPLGQAPQYMPVVSATNIPLAIYQAKGSGIISQFPALLAQLRKHDSPIYVQHIPEIMSLFYQQPASTEMLAGADQVTANIKKMIQLLERHPLPMTAVPITRHVETRSGIDIALKPIAGTPRPIAIALPETDGKLFSRQDYTGKVTLINFWATWCAPCIEEIPSLNRLQTKMQGTPFELISINYAEDKKYIEEFRQKVRIEFPVLMDRDGGFARQWNVISYPSTFIVDSQGVIRYGVNAAINWDAPEVIERLKGLYRSGEI